MRNDYVIITDSTTDLPQAYADALGLIIVPYIFRMEDKEYLNYLDHRELPSKDFYKAIREGKTASTSLVTEQRYIDIFEPFCRQGKDILYLCLSTGLSGSYSQSLLAAEHLAKLYPERKLFMIDSLCACMGQGLLAYYAAKAKEEGKSVTENAAYMRSIIPNIVHWVRADDLNHLRRGGRVSGAAAFVGTMLNIKPLIHMDDEGRLIPMAKVRGRANSLAFIVDKYKECRIIEEKPIAFISHSDAQEEALSLKALVTERFGPIEIVVNDIGPVIGAHTGTGTVTLFFLGRVR